MFIEMHNNFIISLRVDIHPVSKASNSFCKRYYTNLLIKLTTIKEKQNEKSELEKIYIASYFMTIIQIVHCLRINTSNVIFVVLNFHYLESPLRALSSEKYNILIFIFNTYKFSADNEFNCLKFISKEKIIFIINKLDSDEEIKDLITSCIKKTNQNLSNLGYKLFVIFQIFSFWVLRILTNQNRKNLIIQFPPFLSATKIYVNMNTLSILSNK